MTRVKSAALLAAILLSGAFTQVAYAQEVDCRVNETDYASFSEAVRDVMSGKRTGEIELLRDCELDVGTISAPVTVLGAGYAVNIPAQSASENGALAIYSSLHFRNARVSLSNPGSWSAVIGSQGELRLTEGSECDFTRSGVYTSPDAVISLDASSMSLEDMRYTCMMAEAYGKLRLTNGSQLNIARPVSINGITGFDIGVDASRLNVTGCPRQGLVKCSLTLSNGATADISSNGVGYNMYSYNALTVNSGTSLRMNNNTSAAILMQGKSTVNILSGGNFECCENGIDWKAENTDAAYGSKAAVNIGWFNAQYIYTGGIFNVEDGAVAGISDNYTRAITNYGRAYLGAGTVVSHNGALAEGETATQRRVERGGGINNHGALTLADGVILDNNHSSMGGDDIYNAADSTLSISAVAEGRTLDGTPDTNDCMDPITGWFLDGSEQRWKAHGDEGLYMEEISSGDYSSLLELKAAHGLLPAPPTGDVESAALWLVLLLMSAAGFVVIRRRIRGGK